MCLAAVQISLADNPSYCTNYQFSRTYSWPIGTQPKTTDVYYLRVVFVKNATGAQHISDGTGSGTTQVLCDPYCCQDK